MTLDAGLLVLYCIVVICYGVAFSLKSKKYGGLRFGFVQIGLTLADVIVQLAMCYICITMGSDE